MLTERCALGITANRVRLRGIVENSIGSLTALNPYIGYSNTTEVAQEALALDKSVYQLVLKKGSNHKKCWRSNGCKARQGRGFIHSFREVV